MLDRSLIGPSGSLAAYLQVVTWLSRALGAVAAMLIAAAVLIIIHLIFFRYVIGVSTSWQIEYATYALVASTFLGAPYVSLQRAHISVHLLSPYLGRNGRLAFGVVSELAGLALWATLLWFSFPWWYQAYANNWISSSADATPLWIPQITLPIALIGLVLQAGAELGRLLSDPERAR